MKGARQNGEAQPPAGPKPQGPDRPEQPPADEAGRTGIPPLPEPDVEGVGEESGPSADVRTDTLQPDQKKMADDGTGF